MCPKEGTKAIENVVIGKWVCAQSYLTLVTPWTVACQDPLFMEFSRQECWSGLPFPSPGHLPNPGIESVYFHWQADSLPLHHLRSNILEDQVFPTTYFNSYDSL